MNDTHAQSFADATRPKEQESAASEKPAATSPGATSTKSARPAPSPRGGATLGDAAGAQALRALGRELRQAGAVSHGSDEVQNDLSTASEFTAPGAPQRARRTQATHSGKRKARQNREHASGRMGHSQTGDQSPAKTRPARPLHPVLLRLRELYPHLFGEQPLPLKRGIYQDLLAAHGEAELDPAGLKLALGLHTRSYRYLSAVSQGMPRHDLQGQIAEAMAPEHVHHALLEVFRRRKPRDGEDLAQKLRRRIAIAIEASGLTRESYALLMRGRNEQANAALDDAMAEVAERDAKAEALRRTFEASGQDMQSFAQMYGMPPQAVHQALQRCAQMARRQAREPVPTHAPNLASSSGEAADQL